MKSNAPLAHKDNEFEQSLEEHLFNVAELARTAGNNIKQGDVAFLVGLFHDLGKSDDYFQKKLTQNPNLSVDHSYAGAKYLCKAVQNTFKKHATYSQTEKIFTEIIAYVISAHHGLYDIPMSKDSHNNAPAHHNKLLSRLSRNKENQYSYKRDVKSFAEIITAKLSNHGYADLETLILKAFDNFQSAWSRLLIHDDSERDYYNGCFVRLYLSFLKNADILDTINAYHLILKPRTQEENQQLMHKYYRSVENSYTAFKSAPKSALNLARAALGKRVKTRAKSDPTGIYRLNLPTGAGKTNLSLRYAMHQVKHHHKERFIYVTPFLSVLEQNAAVIKNVIGEKGVLEHHSNVVQNNTDSDKDIDAFGNGNRDTIMSEYLVNSWDSPVVLTSMVQFFQTLFKTKSANIRRFSNLAHSVIILDEVQSLPIEVTTLFNLMMNFLSQVMDTTIVLCTATQPVYDSEAITHRLIYSDTANAPADIVTLSEDERKIFTRTELHKFDDSDRKTCLSELVDDIIAQNISTLVILNTKAAVAELYQLLAKKTNRPLYQLSTNMCPQHRLDDIQKIKQALTNKNPVICVSTQLIEAGVDIDFERVIRSYAGIDSIVQAAGRCNREGKRQIGHVTLVNLCNNDENLTHLKEIKRKKSATESILRQRSSPIDMRDLNRLFFEKYYVNHQLLMDYPLESGESVYDYLSQNEFSIDGSGYLRQSFKTAGQKMDLIKDESIGVLVPYGDGIEKLKTLENLLASTPHPSAEELVEIKKQLHALQPYTVNLREHDSFLEFTRPYLNEQIYFLQEEYYSSIIGLTSDAEPIIL